MKNISVFQIVVLAVFILVAIIGIAIFAGFGGVNQVSIPKATIWGTVNGGYVTELVRSINEQSTVIEVNYVQKDPETFEAEFVNALAEGNGPDAILLSDEMLYGERNKIQPIPFTTYSERLFLDTFIDGAGIFVSKDGILGVPLSVDPMVMYWNKDILTRSGVSRAPLTWAELTSIGTRIIKKTDESAITTALLPFGEYENVTNAKGILATLFFQASNPITQLDPELGVAHSVIDQASSGASVSVRSAAESIIDFYTSFANPSKELYTWNRSLPKSIDAFLAGNLAFYFGYSSEYAQIQNKNPNLNFDVAAVPQDPTSAPAVYGRMTAFAIVKQSKNPGGALGVIAKMTEQPSIKNWVAMTGLPPVRRDLLAEPAKDAAATVFNKSAIQAKSWLDPDPSGTDDAFKEMVESVTTGKKKVTDAISDARQRIDKLFKK